jgi:hypothetical protein
MASRDWVRRKHAELRTQLEQTTRFLSGEAVRTRIGLGPGTQQWKWYTAEFAPCYDSYLAAYNGWANESLRNKEDTIRFKEAEKAIIAKYTTLYRGMLKDNPLVGNEDLVSMALPVRRSGARMRAEVAKVAPFVGIDLTVIRRVRIRFYDRAGERVRARPEWQRGVEIVWTVAPEPVMEIAGLTHSSFSTRSPYIFEFDDSHRTKYLSLAARWENTRGQKGPWSAVAYTAIP